MFNAETAITYIRQQGNAVELARLAHLLEGKTPSEETIARFAAEQRPDGGFSPFWAPDYSSIDATCYRLAQAEQLGLDASTPVVAAALAFLAGRQQPDGAWEEDQLVAGQAPPWATPGDNSARLYLTANAGYWLALFGDYEEQARRAGNVVAAHLRPDGELPSFKHTHWLAAGLWYLMDRRDNALHVLDYLHPQLDTFSAQNLSWMLTTLRAAGMPTTMTFLRDAATRLGVLQQEDGRWASDDDHTRDVHVTLEALRALGH